MNTLALRNMYKYSTVVFDLSGVLIDFGVNVPTIAMKNALASQKIYVPEKTIKQNMIFNNVNLLKFYCNVHKCPNVFYPVYDTYIQELIRLNQNDQYTTPINGAIETTIKLRNQGYGIGINTIYNRDIMKELKNKLIKYGFEFDTIVCPDDIKLSSPINNMLKKTMKRLNSSSKNTLKIGESYTHLIDAINTHVDTVNIIDSSSEMNTEESLFNMSSESIKNSKRNIIMDKYINNIPPKYIINNINDLSKLLV
jgi:beta-phosphoglucomutase-like phosphatase (HAD superfamily)